MTRKDNLDNPKQLKALTFNLIPKNIRSKSVKHRKGKQLKRFKTLDSIGNKNKLNHLKKSKTIQFNKYKD